MLLGRANRIEKIATRYQKRWIHRHLRACIEGFEHIVGRLLLRCSANRLDKGVCSEGGISCGATGLASRNLEAFSIPRRNSGSAIQYPSPGRVDEQFMGHDCMNDDARQCFGGRNEDRKSGV